MTQEERKVVRRVAVEIEEEKKKRLYRDIDRLRSEMNIRVKKPAAAPNPKSMMIKKKKKKLLQRKGWLVFSQIPLLTCIVYLEQLTQQRRKVEEPVGRQ